MSKSANKIKASDSKENEESKSSFVIGIGASAGGLEAIHEFFDNIPENTGLSYVIIQHLSPDYKSLMAELLTKHTKMKVFEANDGMEVEPDRVYVIPNKKNLIIKDNQLKLIDKTNLQTPNTAIDIFFESLAEDKQNNAVAVILSGTGTDGTKGIASIHRNGGLVIVQDPLTAKFDGMPNSAIAGGNVDFILPPELMYDEIATHIKQGPFNDSFPEINGEEHASLLGEIMELIRNHTSYDFTYYKRPTINRRIVRRMMLNNKKSLQEYLELLYGNPGEVQLLCKEFLIGVTKFFRDTEAWETVRTKVVPEIVKKKSFNESVKVWVAGCSTGEEAYSVAIAIKEELTAQNRDLNVKIFATDIDKEALEVAAKGIYSETNVQDLSPSIIDKYFSKEGEKYQISPSIRKMVIFANHDLIKDPPFSKIDFISCRNLLIYLNPILQKKVMSTFHFSLNMGAYLFLGSSETAGELKNSLADVDKKWKIYKCIQTSKGIGFEGFASGLSLKNIVNPVVKSSKSQMQNNFSEILHDTILEEFGFAGVYVDENYELIHAVGDFKQYIQLPDKKLNLNILKMIPEELTIPLGTALRKAGKQSEKVTVKNIRIKQNKKVRVLNLVVRPIIEEHKQYSRFFLVLFSDSKGESEVVLKDEEYYNSEATNNHRIKDLEYELKETKENLQAAIEELETSNEELQSANEELLSANEELQSTNEELQSLNEELHTVNSEHQLKIKELIELNDDLNNYFRTNDIGQVYIDGSLLIRKYTPAATRLINLIETDIGRPINHISNNILYDKLEEEIKNVLRTGDVVEKEIQLKNNKWFILRIVPYIRQDKNVDGVVVTFLDVTKLKELNELLSGVLNGSLSTILAFKAVRNEAQELVDFEFTLANPAAEKFLKTNVQTVIGKRLLDEFKFMKPAGIFDKFTQVLVSGKAMHWEGSIENGSFKGYYDIIAVKMGEGLAVTVNDISETKLAEEKLKQAYDELRIAQQRLQLMNSELERRVDERTHELKVSEEYLKQSNESLRRINNDLDNFIYTASHDLRAPISNIEGLVDAIESVIYEDNKEAKEIVELMRFSVNKFKETIKDLTEISRIQKEKNEDIQEVDVKELLDEVKMDIKDMIFTTQASIQEELKETKIRFSKKNLRSIFYNLLSNAIKYHSPKRIPEVKILTERKDGFIQFSISDNGLGIPEKHHGKIFSMFKRFHDHVDGTGVGLYIVKRILDNEGGVIKLESEEDKGTTFKLYFKSENETVLE